MNLGYSISDKKEIKKDRDKDKNKNSKYRKIIKWQPRNDTENKKFGEKTT